MLALPALLWTLTGCFRPTPFVPVGDAWRWSRSGKATGSATDAHGGAPPAVGGDVLTLDLEQAIGLALRADPSLLARSDRLSLADARSARIAQLENPNLLVRNASVNRLAQREAHLELALRVPVPQPWARDAQRQRASLEREALAADRLGRQQRVRARVRQLYARLALLEQSEAAVARTLDHAPRAVSAESDRAGAGDHLDLDRGLLLLRHAEVADLRHTLRLRREAAVAQLRWLLGLGPERQVVFRLEPPAATGQATPSTARGAALLATDEAVLVRRALNQRWELRRAAARVASAEAGTFLARLERWPWPRYLELSYLARPELDADGLQFAFSLGVPLLSWNGGAIAERDARRAQAANQTRQTALAIAQQVHTTLARARTCTQRVRELERLLLPALAATKDVDQALTEGLISPRRALTAQLRRLRAQQRFLAAALDQREALIDLELAVGEAPADGHRQAQLAPAPLKATP